MNNTKQAVANTVNTINFTEIKKEVLNKKISWRENKENAFKEICTFIEQKLDSYTKLHMPMHRMTTKAPYDDIRALKEKRSQLIETFCYIIEQAQESLNQGNYHLQEFGGISEEIRGKLDQSMYLSLQNSSDILNKIKLIVTHYNTDWKNCNKKTGWFSETIKTDTHKKLIAYLRKLCPIPNSLEDMKNDINKFTNNFSWKANKAKATRELYQYIIEKWNTQSESATNSLGGVKDLKDKQKKLIKTVCFVLDLAQLNVNQGQFNLQNFNEIDKKWKHLLDEKSYHFQNFKDINQAQPNVNQRNNIKWTDILDKEVYNFITGKISTEDLSEYTKSMSILNNIKTIVSQKRQPSSKKKRTNTHDQIRDFLETLVPSKDKKLMNSDLDSILSTYSFKERTKGLVVYGTNQHNSSNEAGEISYSDSDTDEIIKNVIYYKYLDGYNFFRHVQNSINNINAESDEVVNDKFNLYLFHTKKFDEKLNKITGEANYLTLEAITRFKGRPDKLTGNYKGDIFISKYNNEGSYIKEYYDNKITGVFDKTFRETIDITSLTISGQVIRGEKLKTLLRKVDFNNLHCITESNLCNRDDVEKFFDKCRKIILANPGVFNKESLNILGYQKNNVLTKTPANSGRKNDVVLNTEQTSLSAQRKDECVSKHTNSELTNENNTSKTPANSGIKNDVVLNTEQTSLSAQRKDECVSKHTNSELTNENNASKTATMEEIYESISEYRARSSGYRVS